MNFSFHPVHHSEMNSPGAVERWEAYRNQIGRPVSSQELLDFVNQQTVHNGMHEFGDVRSRTIAGREKTFARLVLAARGA